MRPCKALRLDFVGCALRRWLVVMGVAWETVVIELSVNGSQSIDE